MDNFTSPSRVTRNLTNKACHASILLVFYFCGTETLYQHGKNLRVRVKEIWPLGECKYLSNSVCPLICLFPTPLACLSIHVENESLDTILTTGLHWGVRNGLLKAAPCLSCGQMESAEHVTLRWQPMKSNTWQASTMPFFLPCEIKAGTIILR